MRHPLKAESSGSIPDDATKESTDNETFQAFHLNSQNPFATSLPLQSLSFRFFNHLECDLGSIDSTRCGFAQLVAARR